MAKEVRGSVVEHFSLLTDPRIVAKTDHKLIDIVAIAVCAALAGADDWVEIANFGEAKKNWFRTFLELPNGIPSHDTLDECSHGSNRRNSGSALAAGFVRFSHPLKKASSPLMVRPVDVLMIEPMVKDLSIWSMLGRFKTTWCWDR